MGIYVVQVSAVYHVDAENGDEARVKALENMRLELIQCPENSGDFDTEVSLLSES